jgi:hypothetical protein
VERLPLQRKRRLLSEAVVAPDVAEWLCLVDSGHSQAFPERNVQGIACQLAVTSVLPVADLSQKLIPIAFSLNALLRMEKRDCCTRCLDGRFRNATLAG